MSGESTNGSMRWVPLESNPEVLNRFIHKLGVPADWELVDVYGLDPELLAFLPSPVVAMILLFPINEKYEEFRKQEEEEVKAKGQEVSPKVYFMKQTIGNACGTVALLHSILNNKGRIPFDGANGHLQRFLDMTSDMNPDEIAKFMETDADICSVHEETAMEGQTEAPSSQERTNLHFVSLIQQDGGLYELDGRKPFPIRHGESSDETFLHDAAAVCSKFMARDPDELHFSMLALAKSL